MRPPAGKSGAPSARRRRAVEAMGTAAAAIGPIERGTSVFLLTRGQFSMLDMVVHVLNELGPSAVSVWTWAIADYEVEAMYGFMGSKLITSARLVVDRSAETNRTRAIEDWRRKFGGASVRVCKNHAKIARVWNAERRVLLRGSMNLNFNPRFEQADITEGGEDFDLVESIEDALPVLPVNCSNEAADAASGLTRVFAPGDLQLFGAVKAWAK